MISAYTCLVLGIVAVVLVNRLVSKPSSRRSTRASLPLPPGPPPLPFLGNVHQVPKVYPWLKYGEWSKTYGPVMHINMLGQPVIILTSVKAAYDLLSRKGATYSDRPRLIVANELAAKNRHILLRRYDERQRLHTKISAPLLHPNAVSSYTGFVEMETRQLLLDLVNASDREPDGVYPHDHVMRATASTIYALTYGYRLLSTSEPELVEAQAIQKEFTTMAEPGTYLVDSFPFLNKLPLPGFLTPWKRDAERHFRAQRDLHIGNLRRGLAGPAWNFSKHLRHSPDTAGMGEEELAFNPGIVADAALDTTTQTMDFFFVACLTQRRSRGGGDDFVATAQRIIYDVVGTERLPVLADRPALPYVDAIIEELLRWRPIAPGGMAHRNMAEDAYGGFAIPEGATVLANHWSICRDASVFGEDADDFIPERWLPDGDGAAADGTGGRGKAKGEVVGPLKDLPTIGFGYGRRRCPGRHLARNSLWLQIVRLLWAFDIEPAAEVPDAMNLTLGFVSCPKPYKAVFKPKGPWVREIISSTCDTRDVDFVSLLNSIEEGWASKG